MIEIAHTGGEPQVASASRREGCLVAAAAAVLRRALRHQGPAGVIERLERAWHFEVSQPGVDLVAERQRGGLYPSASAPVSRV